MEFRCAPLDLCFNGGVCNVDNATGLHFCSCPDPAYSYDASWFHDPSCTLPKHFYMAHLIELSIVTWIALFLLARLMHREKGRLWHAAFWSCGGTLNTWLYVVGLFAQNGSFEMCGFFLTCLLLCCSLCALQLIHMQVAVLRGVDQLIQYQILSKSLNKTTCACFVVSIMIGLAWMILCRTPSHNTVTRTSLCSIFFWNAVYVFEIFYFTTRLILEIQKLQTASADSHGNTTTTFRHWQALIQRVARLRLVIGVYFTLLCFGILPLVTIHFVLGSTPYGFIMICSALHCPAILSFGVLVLARQKRKARVTTGENAEDVQGGDGDKQHAADIKGAGGQQQQQQPQDRQQNDKESATDAVLDLTPADTPTL